MPVEKYRVKAIFVAYLCAGFMYEIVARMVAYITGKEITFSLLVGLPMSMISWPFFVYLDIRWIGIMLQDIVAIITMVVVFLLYKKRSPE